MVTARQSMSGTVGALQRDPAVKAVWIGGSVRDGSDDEVSDLDLWVEASEWSPDRLVGLLVGGTHNNSEENPLLHGVDAHGVIIDLRYGAHVPPEYRRLDIAPGHALPTGAMDPPGFKTDFWVNSYKHRKPLWRGLDAMVLFGLPLDRMALMRAWVGEATGDPNREISFTIHGLTAIVREHMTPARMALLGLPTRTRSELLVAIRAFRSEMFRMSPSGLRLPRIVMDDPVFARICEEAGV
ncbi:MAG: hypothetical protein ACYC96_14990 [Fimbriimonadaceae bacterium]